MSIDDEVIDVTKHFHVVDAFDMPRLQYDYHRKVFSKSNTPPTLLGTAKDKAEMYRDRLNLVKQRLLRHERFCPTAMHLDKQSYIKITPIKALIGHDTQHFTLFGMLTQLEEGKYFLEDDDAHIELHMTNFKFDVGLFTDGTFVIVAGIYENDRGFIVNDISFPPPEPRITTDIYFPHVDFCGFPQTVVDEKRLQLEEETNDNVFFVILSDVFLDQPKVMMHLRRIFEKYENEKIPFAFILIGNFSSGQTANAGLNPQQYRDNFNHLAELIGQFKAIATQSRFIVVPGAQDPWGGNLLPQTPIPDLFTTRLRQKVKHITFASNPCRIRYCTQDIVLFREDIQNRLWRNALIHPNIEDHPNPANHVVRTVIDQGHLCPLPLSIRPIYWSHDHALRLYPLPHMLILADHSASYGINYNGTHCLNPGSFANSDYIFMEYHPSRKSSQQL
ncbi:DNA polymerase alpha/epsilon subunit B-domain-containing protein [Gongronella butleri]|nr:DNA polymerase alpha/epsilon subunit B-domain-containing protein [Gongronella butleri]